MCDVCTTIEANPTGLNGERLTYHKVSLFQVFSNSNALVILCRYHDIELFLLGETKFLARYNKFYGNIIDQSARFKSDRKLPNAKFDIQNYYQKLVA